MKKNTLFCISFLLIVNAVHGGENPLKLSPSYLSVGLKFGWTLGSKSEMSVGLEATYMRLDWRVGFVFSTSFSERFTKLHLGVETPFGAEVGPSLFISKDSTVSAISGTIFLPLVILLPYYQHDFIFEDLPDFDELGFYLKLPIGLEKAREL